MEHGGGAMMAKGPPHIGLSFKKKRGTPCGCTLSVRVLLLELEYS